MGFLLRQQRPDKERLWLLWLVLNFGYDIKELMWCYDQRIKPFRREMSQIARHEIVGAGSLCTLQKNIVVRIGAGSHFVGGFDPDARFPDSPKGICNFALGPLEAGPANHFFVLGIDFAADAKPSGGPRNSHQQYVGWQSLRLKQTGNQNIRVKDNPDHWCGD